jgi:DNA topoisomerase-3
VTTVVLAEKPSVARDIAAVLGARRKQYGSLEGDGYVVTWAMGHLVGIAEPHEMNPSWKTWRADLLPLIPQRWDLVLHPETRDHFERVKSLLNAPSVERVVCATDAGREGELIFRYIYRVARCRKPVLRLWISSLTPEAIRKGFRNLRPSAHFDCLAQAAEARSRADWLVGMNLSRAYTLRHDDGVLSVGRVQTPTLSMIVDREIAIRDFVPQPYCEVQATFNAQTGAYVGTWFDPKRESDRNAPPQRLDGDGVQAETIRARCEGKDGIIESVEGTDKATPPPLLYDLTELQRHANRLFGLRAETTLAVAQSLYEKHKLITYPRTDSRYLPTDVANSLGPVLDAIAESYGTAVAEGSGTTPLSSRFVQDAKVTDHHAIIPTSNPKKDAQLSRDELRIYDLICRRLLMAWHQPHETRTTTVVTTVRSTGAVDRFRSSGTMVTKLGWKVLDIASKKTEQDLLPDGLAVGLRCPVEKVEVLHKETKPPARFNDASLLTAMETAGKLLEDRELEKAMRERGLGTPATRAAIVETLVQRGYVQREGKALVATERGISLVAMVDERIKSPSLTGEWELALKRMEQGDGNLQGFMTGIETLVRDVVQDAKSGKPHRHEPTTTERSPRQALGQDMAMASETGAAHDQAEEKMASGKETMRANATLGERWKTANSPLSAPTGDLEELLRDRFGFKGFRPFQREVCESTVQGDDGLLVMPTGSGKSLCYQLPGLARGGVTLVISPLIALMEDQAGKLSAAGFRAEQVHSGRTREQSRQACRAYLRGEIDFLFIAPERLAVTGFPEMLARRKPSLIAVDEAHCISHWGHDFRPDYRLLGDRLPLLRPSPVLALTATATIRVQDDIVKQLGIPTAQRFIRGFRRDNIGIEVLECKPADRAALVRTALSQQDRLPAIVYVPTRKMADQLGASLGREMRAGTYHAGLETDARARVQEAFASGQLDVIVATVAFGMGIDKANIRTVIHTALPGSIEAYYQEIGRAGRDGKPSRALLLFSWADRHLLDMFLEKSYPPIETIQRLLDALPRQGLPRESWMQRPRLEPAVVEVAVNKLWIHGAVQIDGDDWVRHARPDWQQDYLDIRAHREAQIEAMFDFARPGTCRMVRLIRHFGDRDDDRACGLCDICQPAACVAARFRRPTGQEVQQMTKMWLELESTRGIAAGTLYRKLFEGSSVQRDRFETWVDALAKAGAIEVIEDSFEKDGKLLRYRKLLKKQQVSFEQVQLPDPAATTEAQVRKGKTRILPSKKPTKTTQPEPPYNPAVAERLRTWRLEQARAKRIPAFRIMTDRTLYAIASQLPSSMETLLLVPGVGPKLADKYGPKILQLVRRGSSPRSR